MTDEVEAEIRQRFGEASIMINHARSISPAAFQPLDDLQKSVRAFCLVSIYAAVERSSNAIVEMALAEFNNHKTPTSSYIPSLQGLLHFSRIKSLRDCGNSVIFDRSTELFGAAFTSNAAKFVENPLATSMQNVDGGTLEWLASIFGIEDYKCDPANRGRLSNLRERRNAVAHGRETASSVGERFTVDEISNVYNAADKEITRFLLAIRKIFPTKSYTRQAA